MRLEDTTTVKLSLPLSPILHPLPASSFFHLTSHPSRRPPPAWLPRSRLFRNEISPSHPRLHDPGRRPDGDSEGEDGGGQRLTEEQGRGGESCWGEKFEDEIDSRLSHKSGRNVSLPAPIHSDAVVIAVRGASSAWQTRDPIPMDRRYAGGEEGRRGGGEEGERSGASRKIGGMLRDMFAVLYHVQSMPTSR
eukprot:746647-Hanusia_phi.AAC.1